MWRPYSLIVASDCYKAFCLAKTVFFASAIFHNLGLLWLDRSILRRELF